MRQLEGGCGGTTGEMGWCLYQESQCSLCCKNVCSVRFYLLMEIELLNELVIERCDMHFVGLLLNFTFVIMKGP